MIDREDEQIRFPACINICHSYQRTLSNQTDYSGRRVCDVGWSLGLRKIDALKTDYWARTGWFGGDNSVGTHRALIRSEASFFRTILFSPI